MDLRDTPHLNEYLQKTLRPLAEKLRAILYTGQAALATHVELTTLLAAAAQVDPNAILVDGRAAEGVRPLTVGEAYTACQFLVDMLQWSQNAENEPRGTAALKLCVRHMTAE